MKAKLIVHCKRDDIFNLIGPKMFKQFNNDFEKQMQKGIITIDMEPYDKGGKITVNMEGSRKEINEWTKIKWREKPFLKAMKPLMEVEVIK